MKHIRNFAIIAHIDHGKSTLSDRFIERAGLLQNRNELNLVMDNLDLEKERGITIKANNARLIYRYQETAYTLNLIDTPGHVDFSYEVIRSLAACEGVILLVDATQGVEAQTLANLNLAMETGKVIIPAINKIDVKTADVDRIKNQMVDLGFAADEILKISAKSGIGLEELFQAIIERIPAPTGDPSRPLRALVFDAKYDDYVGGVIYLRLFDGKLRKKMNVRFFKGTGSYEVIEIGYLTPDRLPVNELTAGAVGYCIAGFKSLKEINIGDTLFDVSEPNIEPLPGYREAKPMVFCGMYPVRGSDIEELKKAMQKLHLNDSSFEYLPDTSAALGFGCRCGFLGLLHMDIIQERLEREFNLDLIITSPNVRYRVKTRNTPDPVEVENPSKFPNLAEVEYVEEPFVVLKIITPSDYVGLILELLNDRRGVQIEMIYLDVDKVMLTYDLPLSEMIFDFYDKLKSVSKGYASMDYSEVHYQQSDMVKLDLLVNDERVDALSIIVHSTKAYRFGKNLVRKLKEVIPRHMFMVPIQAAIGSRVIARETISALRKNVIAKCYGGDVTRKRKLLEKQKEGKKRMKMVGNVEIPQEGFMAVLSANDVQ